MATTYTTLPLDGTTREFTIPFEYLTRRFVNVTLIGTTRKPLVLNVDFRFVTPTKISTTVAWGPANGYDTIELRRNTSATDRLVDFNDGSILRASDLNISQVQAIHIAEEGRAISSQSMLNNLLTWDALNLRIRKVSDPIDPQDAATKSYVDGTSSSDRSYLDQQLSRTLRGPSGEAIGLIGGASTRASKVLGFDAIGNPTVLLPQSGSGTEVVIDLANNIDPLKGAGMVARSVRMINSIQELAGLTGRYANETIKLASWHAGRNFGGGDLFWSTTMAKSKHDGGMVFSPTVPWTSNIQNYLNGVGESDSVGEGCWVRPDSEYWCEMFGAVPFVNDGRQGIDATIPIQKALYSAKRNEVLLTHSISDLRPVKGGGMFLVQGILYFPEGVVWEGTDMIATGFAFGWTQTTKISGYGKLHDTLNGNAAGTTFTKNWGLRNMTMAPYYYESGPSSCVYLDLVRDIEPRLQDVRFIMHKGAVKGGQLNATAIRFAKVEDPDFNNITMDGGSNHLYTALGVEWGVRKARISRAYSYNARDNAVFLASASSKNKVEIEIQMAEQVGSNYGVNIEDGFDNRIDVTASGSKLRYGAILNGHGNVVIGTINDALLSTVDVRGEGNQAILSYSGPSPVDTGKNSVIISSKGIKVAGVSQGNKSGLSLTSVNTWYDVARIAFTPGVAGACVLKASTGMEVAGLDRDCFVGQWMVQTNAAGVVSSTFNVSSKFSVHNSIEMQVVPFGSSAANLQIRTVSGTSATGDVQFELSGDNKVTIKAL